jgi:thiamine-phosphate pyrophosphorylase
VQRCAMNSKHPRPRLYLITPLLDDPTSFGRQLAPALEAGDVAAVLLRLAAAEERTLINRTKAVAAIVQRRDVALILDGHFGLVARTGADGADGAHLTGMAALNAALPVLKPDRIAGAGGLRSRHDAMLAGEAGADYVMFGEPDRQGQRPPFEAVLERLAWWAELLEPPCVGYAAAADEIHALAHAGADFVALGEWIWTQPGGAEQAVAAAAQNLAAPA